MKTLLLALLLSATSARAGGIYPGHYSGGLISTRCIVPVGAQITFDLADNGVMHATLTDDGIVTGQLIGTVKANGSFVLFDQLGGVTRFTGTVRPIRSFTYLVITGTGHDENCAYRFQARWRHF